MRTKEEAEAQQLRYALHSLLKIANGEVEDPVKYAVMALKHIRGPDAIAEVGTLTFEMKS